MVNNISTAIRGQIPEYLRDSSPVFVSFLELYYQYAQIRTNGIGAIQYRSLDADIDSTLEKYISEFYVTYAEYIPNQVAIDRRNLIKLLNEVYTSKGTEKSFRLLFKLIYGVESEYKLPGDQILRASDGKWVQESFITVHINYGDIAQILLSDIIVDNFGQKFSFTPNRYESIGNSEYRIYFDSGASFGITLTSILSTVVSGLVTFRAYVVTSPTTLRILSKGNNFQAGQIYQIPGTVEPTLFKVARVSSGGHIESVEIIRYGYAHADSSTVWVSSYRAPPIPSNTESYSVETSAGIFTHHIGVTDTVHNIIERVSGISSGTNSNSYFLQDYVDPGYTGYPLFDTDYGDSGYPVYFSDNRSISMAQYLADRASVQLISGVVSKLPGKYQDNLGQLSDSFIKLQDNYYYQLFSYVIGASIDSSVYRDTILKILHPAGLKTFSQISKSYEIDISGGIEADSKYTYRLDFSDSVSTLDSVDKTLRMVIVEASNVLAGYAIDGYMVDGYVDQTSFTDTVTLN